MGVCRRIRYLRPKMKYPLLKIYLLQYRNIGNKIIGGLFWKAALEYHLSSCLGYMKTVGEISD